MNKHELEFDERQLQKRHRLGNDAFTMLTLLLMVDTLLYHFGFRWVPYPTNIFILVVFCCGVFVVRAIWQGAFVGPGKSGAKNWAGAMAAALLAAFGAIVVINYQKTKGQIAAPSSDEGAWLLMLVSWSLLAIAGMAWLWKRHKEKREEE